MTTIILPKPYQTPKDVADLENPQILTASPGKPATKNGSSRGYILEVGDVELEEILREHLEQNTGQAHFLALSRLPHERSISDEQRFNQFCSVVDDITHKDTIDIVYRLFLFLRI